jgi:hypothetical protein
LDQISQLVKVKQRIPIAIMVCSHFIDLNFDKAKKSLCNVSVVILTDLLSRKEHLNDEEHWQRVSSYHKSFVNDQILDPFFNGRNIKASIA